MKKELNPKDEKEAVIMAFEIHQNMEKNLEKDRELSKEIRTLEGKCVILRKQYTTHDKNMKELIKQFGKFLKK